MRLSDSCSIKTKRDCIIKRKKTTMDMIVLLYIHIVIFLTLLFTLLPVPYSCINIARTHTYTQNANCLPILSFSSSVTHRILISFGEAMCSLKDTVSDGRSSSIFIFLSIWTIYNGWRSSSYYVIVSERPKKPQRPWLSHP